LPWATAASWPVPAPVIEAAPASAARVQVVPPSGEDQSAGPPFTPPAATSVAPAAPIAVRVTRVVPAAPVKLAPASRAGGKPAASADGASPPLPPPPVITTTAMPTTIAATIGTARPITQFRLRMTLSTPPLAARTDDLGGCSGSTRNWRSWSRPNSDLGACSGSTGRSCRRRS